MRIGIPTEVKPLEGRVALEEVLARFPRWEVDWGGVERVTTSTVRGFAKLPIRI